MTLRELQLKELYMVDLTAMFGTTIADYVYTLETQTAGSGIAWLQSYGFFTEDYYAYKQNTLESGCVSAHKTYDGETLLTNTELSPITIRGLLGLSDGKLTVNGDKYNADGSIISNYKEDLLKDLNWQYNSSVNWFYSQNLMSTIEKPSSNSILGKILSEKYVTYTRSEMGTNTSLIGICVDNNVI